MSHSLRVPLAIGLLFLTTGASDNGCIAAEVEVESVCVTRAGIEIGPTNGHSATTSFTIDDFGTIGELAAKNGEMYFTQIVIRPDQGTIGSISTAQATVSSGDPNSSLPTLEMMCSGDCIDADGNIPMPAGLDRDAASYVSSGTIIIELAVTGELPAEPWTVTVDVCVAGRFGASL